MTIFITYLFYFISVNICQSCSRTSFFQCCYVRSGDSPATVVSVGYWLREEGQVVLLPFKQRCSCREYSQTGTGAQPASYSADTLAFFSGGRVTGVSS